MFVLTLVQCLFVAVGVVLFYNYYYKRRKLPPGPPPLPLVGNLMDVMKKPPGEDAFIDWKKQYGNVYTYWMGEHPIVIVADYKTMIDSFQKDGDAYAGRSTRYDRGSTKLDIMTRGCPRGGVVFTDGDLWREHRRFTLQVLRNFGLSKDLMQERVLDEVSALIAKVNGDAANGKEEHDIPALLDVRIGSVINSLLFGYRFDGKHESEFYELKRLFQEDMRLVVSWKFRMLSPYPELLSRVPPFKEVFESVKHSRTALWNFYQRQIDEHVKNIDFETEAVPTDYAEAFLKEKAKRDAEGGEHSFTIGQLKGMCADLFVAGQETTASTLQWGVAFLITNADAQQRMHQELDRVIGSDRMVTMTDRPNLPYTNAVINEIQRLCNLVPQNIPHTTTKDVTLDGFFLPKGTDVIPQISAIFPDPKKFIPERHLDENGHVKRIDELLQFSVGKRLCLGESLARMELFLFTANIFNQFRVLPGAEKPSMRRNMGATVLCTPYTCRVEKRYL